MNTGRRTVLLPSDLDSSLALLDESEFARLLAAVTREEARRHANQPLSERNSRELPAEAPTTTRTAERASETIAPAKANLVRSALKAGVKPSAIARQFGLSNAVISQVLRSKEK